MPNEILEICLVTMRTAPTVLVIICGFALNYRQRRERPRVFNLLALAAMIEVAQIGCGLVWRLLSSSSDRSGDSQFVSYVVFLTILQCLNAVCWALMLWAILGIDARPNTSARKPD